MEELFPVIIKGLADQGLSGIVALIALFAAIIFYRDNKKAQEEKNTLLSGYQRDLQSMETVLTDVSRVMGTMRDSMQSDFKSIPRDVKENLQSDFKNIEIKIQEAINRNQNS